MNKENDFHKSRIAFAIINKDLHIIQNDPRGHKEWLLEEFGLDEQNFEKIVRGYIKEDKIVFYKGSDFTCDSEVCDIAYSYFYKLLSYTNSRKVNIYAGVIRGEIGEEWKPQKLLFKLEMIGR